jgi:hypothetical protein
LATTGLVISLHTEPGTEQRTAFLKEACAGDEQLRREVESMLAYNEQAEGFILMSFNDQNNVRLVLSAGIGVLFLFLSCFALWTQAEEKPPKNNSAQPRSVERRLQKYLNGRVLVFRNGEINGHQIQFDSQGRPLKEEVGGPDLSPKAILFIGLQLGTEQLMIVGEAVQVRPGGSGAICVRNPGEFSLVTCKIGLDVPAEKLTFTNAVGLLCRVFLTKEEFERASFGLRSPER